jgi:hypothetical protein
MSYRRDLKLLRRAQKQTKRQLRQLAELEITGLTAVTLHTHTQLPSLPPQEPPLRIRCGRRCANVGRRCKSKPGTCCSLGWRTNNCASVLPRLPARRCPNGSLPLVHTYRGWLPSGWSPRVLLLHTASYYAFPHHLAPTPPTSDYRPTRSGAALPASAISPPLSDPTGTRPGPRADPHPS